MMTLNEEYQLDLGYSKTLHYLSCANCTILLNVETSFNAYLFLQEFKVCMFELRLMTIRLLQSTAECRILPRDVLIKYTVGS